MKIECTSEEWFALSALIIIEFSTSIEYNFPNFNCEVANQDGEFLFEIEGVFKDSENES